MTTADIFYLALVISGATLFAITLGYYSVAVADGPAKAGKQ